VIEFLEDRRVLFPYNERNPEEAIFCIRSAMKIREFLTDEIHRAKPGGGLNEALRSMRAAARKFVEAGGPDGENWLRSGRRSQGVDPFSAALGGFRTAMGIHIAAIALTYGLSIESNLAGILPPAAVDED